MSNLFAGLKDAKTYDRGTFLKPGIYTLKVKRAVFKRTRKNYDAFILEFEVVSAKGVDTNLTGTSASWFQSLADTDIGFGSLKAFAAAVTGADVKDPAFVDEVEGFLSGVVEDGALNGKILPCEVVLVDTRAGGKFSLHKWGEAL
jgi:hypothetical protein